MLPEWNDAAPGPDAIAMFPTLTRRTRTRTIARTGTATTTTATTTTTITTITTTTTATTTTTDAAAATSTATATAGSKSREPRHCCKGYLLVGSAPENTRLPKRPSSTAPLPLTQLLETTHRGTLILPGLTLSFQCI